jgi:glycosyltransferase involved in cell wall biosynthesis
VRDLTVVVTAPGSCAALERCLGSLASQTLSPDLFEVVVVLHGPGDSAREALKRTGEGALSRHALTLADGVAPTAGAARNEGVDLARAEWVTFVDGRDTVSTDLLETLYAARSTERVAAARLSPGFEPRAGTGHVAPESALGLLRSRGGTLLPTEWLRAQPFDDALDAEADAVLSGRLLSAFEHRFVTYDVTPALAGATYHLHRTASDDIEATVRERVRALSALTLGTQADPADRSPVTTALVAAELADLGREVASVPVMMELANSLLRQAAIRGVARVPTPSTGTEGADTPGVWSSFHTAPDDVDTLVVVSGSAGPVNARARMLSFLARNGVGVRIVHYSGRLKPLLRKLPDTHRIEVLPAATPNWLEARLSGASSRSRRLALRATGEALRVGRRVVPEVVPAGVTAAVYRRLDTTAAALLHEPGRTVVLDRAGTTLLRAYADGDHAEQAWQVHDLAGLVLRTAASRLGGSNTDAHAVRDASRILREDPVRTRAAVGPQVWAMVTYRLARAGRLDAAAQLLADVQAVFGDSAAHKHGLPALSTLHAVLTGRESDPDRVSRAARTALDEADAALARSDADGATDPAALDEADAALARSDADGATDPAVLDEVSFLAAVALELLFVRRLHTAVPTTPIVSSPDAFLAPLRETRVGRLLGATTARPPAADPRLDGTVTDRRTRVTLLPGAYPKFAKPVADELSVAADVQVLDLSQVHTRFTNTAVDPLTVRERIRAARGRPPSLDPATAEALAADVVFVDWADKGLTWVTGVVPEDTRVVVRLHGVDTLSAWLHTAEWEKVSDAIFPAEHMRASAAAALGGRLDHVRQHVVPLPLHLDRWALPKRAAAPKTLAMVGWAQQVKDPLWALDVLEELRRHDRDWRLRLIGADFDLGSRNPVERAAAKAFHERMSAEILWDGVDFVGYTARLPEHLQDVGWALSSSRREGFHTGLVEMAVSGAVPVVRDWPVYEELGGAKDLYPRDWVVATPQEAAERILTISDAGEWEAVSAATVEVAQVRFSGADSGARLRQIVLGEA